MTGPILFVEDDDDDTELMLICFKSLGLAAKVECARNGLEALGYLTKALRGDAAMPALILADIKMPKMNGFELLERVRENQLLNGIPFVILTSSRDERDRSEALRLRADSYLQKPSSGAGYADLAAQVRGFVGKARA